MPTEIQYKILYAYLIAGVVFTDAWVIEDQTWLVWINNLEGPVIAIDSDGNTRIFEDFYL